MGPITTRRTMAFIDGTNVYKTCRLLNFSIDYGKTAEWLRSNLDLTRVYYYTAIIDNSPGSPIRDLVTFLDHNGYTTVTKAAKEQADRYGELVVKGNMDAEICVDILRAVYLKQVEHVMLWSGDGDFVPLIKACQDFGVITTLVSTIQSREPVCADQLRRQCDYFVDLAEFIPILSRGTVNNGQV